MWVKKYRFGQKRLVLSVFIPIFTPVQTNTDDVLGIESPRKPISGKFAKELREALVRARTGNLCHNYVISTFQPL